MRDKFLYIAILVLVAIAFFEGGFIVGHLKTDGLKEKLQQVNEWVIDHGGRIVALETIARRRDPSGVQSQTPRGKGTETR